MNDQFLIQEISDVIGVLAAPVSNLEAADGWTPESKKAIKTFFEELRQKLQSGATLPPMNISRALDHWGVISGELLEKSARISNELRTRTVPIK